MSRALAAVITSDSLPGRPPLLVLDTVSLLAKGGVTMTELRNLAQSLGDRVSLGTSCPREPQDSCLSLHLNAAPVSQDAMMALQLTWSGPSRPCGGHFSATYRVRLTASQAQLVKVSDILIGECLPPAG